MSLFPDVVIPESPEAYIKLTENTLKSSCGRKQQGALHELKLNPFTVTLGRTVIVACPLC